MALLDDLDEAPVRFADLMRVRSFRILFAAEIQSLIGDQLARVALAAWVFASTDSVAATALTYALSYLPGILGGVVLAHVGDRLPRVPVLIGADIIRVVFFASMALPGMPVPGLLVLVAAATFVEPAFSAAQFAYLANELSPAMLRAATGLRMATMQAAQVAGFAVGGLAVVALGAPRALVLDALSFALSALLIAVGLRVYSLRERPAAAPARSGAVPVGTTRWILNDRGLTRLVGLICLVGLFVVPEGLAIPYAGEVHGSAVVAGLLLASMPLGGMLGAVLLARWVPPPVRGRAATVMVIGCGLPLTVSAWAPAWPVTFGAWMASGACAAYQVEAITQLARRVPDARRAGVMGVVGGGLIAAQGGAIALFGALGQWVGSGPAIAAAGVIGTGMALTLSLAERPSSSDPRTGISDRPRCLATG